MITARILGNSKGPLPVTQDTREQQPYKFPAAFADIEKQALAVGDYALRGDEIGCTIERKSIGDLIGSVTSGHLESQLARMRDAFGDLLIIVVVDGDKQAFCDWPNWKKMKRATPAWVFSELYRLAYAHRVCVDWNPSRHWAGVSTLRWLRTRQKAEGGAT